MIPRLGDLGREDLYASFSIVCEVLGIGALSMGQNYAKAGPFLATVALLFMGLVNTYATIAVSKCFKNAPPNVKTFGDLGEHSFGKAGRIIVVSTQLFTCILLPIAFLVLGGVTILPRLFPTSSFTANEWIPIMTIGLYPIILIPSLKEGAWIAFLGALATLIGSLAAVTDTMMHAPHYEGAAPKIETDNIITVFGSMSLAYGAAVVIPSIQRDHSKPSNLPFVITISLGIPTAFYIAIGYLTYYQYGCLSPSDLLLKISSRNLELVAMVAFLVHIGIAFAVYLNPAFYILERTIIGSNPNEAEKQLIVQDSLESGKAENLDRYLYKSPNPVTNGRATASGEDKRCSIKDVRVIISGTRSELEEGLQKKTIDFALQNEQSKYRYSIMRIILRTVIVFFLAFCAMLLQSSFTELADFIGATTITLSCIVIPIALQLSMFRDSMVILHKMFALGVIFLILLLGIYTAINYMERILDNISNFELFTIAPQTQSGALSAEFCLDPSILD